jgi:predicted amidohydrolase YtcJ
MAMKHKKTILFTGGRIFLSEDRIIEGSLFVEGERIGDCVAGVPSRVEVEQVDLEGKLLIPGFIDSHTHLFQEGIEMTRPDLSGATSRDALFEMLREAVRNFGKGELIVASDFDESPWREARLPTRRELDRITSENPLIVRRICGHIAVANSAALERISDEWGGVDRETGVMKEDVPLNLSRIFPPDAGGVREGLKEAVRKAHSLGITSIHEVANLANVHFFEELAEAGDLELNVRIYIPVDDIGGVKRPAEAFNRTSFGGIKLFADGSIGARTAASSFEYLDTPGNRGLLTYGQDEIEGSMHEAEEAGIQLMIHAIGDAAIRQLLNAAEKQIEPGNPQRHRIEHCELIDPSDIQRLEELKMVVSMQPNFIKLWSQPGGMYERVLGERYRMNNPAGQMKRMGIEVAFGSDTMPLSPLLGIEGVVTAPFECQRMALEEAIVCYTKHSAKAGFSFSGEGEIKKGKEANLVVFDPDAMKICKTFYRGRCVFGD